MKSNKVMIVVVLIGGIAAGSLLTLVFQSTRLYASDAAKGRFSNVGFASYGNLFSFFDKNTGEVWMYEDGNPCGKYTIISLGAPLKKTKLERGRE